MNTMVSLGAPRQFAHFLVITSLIGGIVSESSTTLGATSASDRSTTRDVCELNNSCTTPSGAKTTTTEKPTERKEADKWRYNVSGLENETAGVFHLERDSNGSAVGLSIDFDVAKNVDNRSAPSNESKPAIVKYYIEPEENCFCDITRGGCDLNCCCDQDCLLVNRNVFQECNRSLAQLDEDSTCIIRVLDSPLLCVVRDNLYSRHFYPQHKIIPEIGQVDKLMMNREHFGWTVVSPRTHQHTREADVSRETFKEYEFGSPLLIVRAGGVQTFHLPKPTLTSRDCNERVPVGFLMSSVTVCTYRLGKDLASECEGENSIFNPSVHFKNISFIMNPVLINDSSKLDCEHNCANITLYVCNSEDISMCTKKNVTSVTPRLDIRNTCQGAVTQVHYNFVHNGTAGVSAVQVFVLLQNINLKANSLWAIKFTTRYEWVNQTETYELSGYQGYVSGKAIITGFEVVTTSLRENRTRRTIDMHHRRDRWLTAFATDVDGGCSETRRRNIHFERDTFAQCSVRMPKIETAEQCEQFQKKIFKILFGGYVNISNVLISVNGAPDVHDSARWVPLVSDLNFVVDPVNDTCSEIITSVNLIILHSAVGDFDKPEQAVIAAKINGTPFGRSVRNHDRVRVTFAVNFYDVTAPPLRVFAEPPTYEVKLPADFFYPFFSSARRPQVCGGMTSWLLIFLVLEFIRTCTAL